MSGEHLALNGLRVSEAADADIGHLGLQRGHRTLVITREGGKIVTIPLAPRTARAIGLAIGERPEGPVLLASGGRQRAGPRCRRCRLTTNRSTSMRRWIRLDRGSLRTAGPGSVIRLCCVWHASQ